EDGLEPQLRDPEDNAANQMDRERRYPMLTAEGEAVAEPEDRRRQRGGGIRADQPRQQDVDPGRGILARHPGREVLGEQEERDQRPAADDERGLPPALA